MWNYCHSKWDDYIQYCGSFKSVLNSIWSVLSIWPAPTVHFLPHLKQLSSLSLLLYFVTPFPTSNTHCLPYLPSKQKVYLLPEFKASVTEFAFKKKATPRCRSIVFIVTVLFPHDISSLAYIKADGVSVGCEYSIRDPSSLEFRWRWQAFNNRSSK